MPVVSGGVYRHDFGDAGMKRALVVYIPPIGYLRPVKDARYAKACNAYRSASELDKK